MKNLLKELEQCKACISEIEYTIKQHVAFENVPIDGIFTYECQTWIKRTADAGYCFSSQHTDNFHADTIVTEKGTGYFLYKQ